MENCPIAGLQPNCYRAISELFQCRENGELPDCGIATFNWILGQMYAGRGENGELPDCGIATGWLQLGCWLIAVGENGELPDCGIATSVLCLGQLQTR